jgi:hypothetical protein
MSLAMLCSDEEGCSVGVTVTDDGDPPHAGVDMRAFLHRLLQSSRRRSTHARRRLAACAAALLLVALAAGTAAAATPATTAAGDRLSSPSGMRSR